MILRPYQAEFTGQVQLQWALGNKVVLAQMPTGGGKTPCLSKLIEEHAGFVCAIAHRDRLVEQLSLMLARCGIRHDLVASEKTKRIIAKKHVKKLGQCFYVPGARCRVASAQTLVKAKGLEKWAQQVTLWVVDECFPAGTLVDGKPIETIKVGDTVTGFNQKTGGFEPRKVTRVFKNKAPDRMMRIAFGEHHVIHCTLGHPFWTRRGWVEAILLTEDDEILTHGQQRETNTERSSLFELLVSGRAVDRKPTLQLAENGSNILQHVMRDAIPRKASGPNTTARNSDRAVPDLRQLSGFAGRAFNSIPQDRTRLLQPEMLVDVCVPAQFGNDGRDEPTLCLGTNDGAQPDARRSDSAEGPPNAHCERLSTEPAGGQRTTRAGSRSDVACDRGRAGLFGTNGHTDQESAGFGIPDELQGRRGQPGTKNSFRSGRQFASDHNPKSAGREERRVSGWVRVDSLEIYERADRQYAGECLDDGHVYNIEVEGLHTYVADGVVVHNCHHLLRDNLWGRCIDKFTHPSCLGLGLTATPGRPDGKGLGRHADGFADAMVLGAEMRWLIDEGFLCDYDVVCPPSDMRIDEAPKGTDGEYSLAQRRTAARESHIVGDVPTHYLKFAAGKSGITFCGDIETATATVAAYRAKGVTAELITGDTDPTIRDQIFDRAEQGQLNQIVAVDVISEGVDIPALQVGSFARLTASIITWLQQLGRLLRPIYAPGYDLETREGRLAAIAASIKPRALLIDHVGGFINPQLGAPDKPRDWTLDRREKRAKKDDTDDVPMRVCANPDVDCFHPYPRVLRACPKCGHEPQPQGRSLPEQVDGDLQMMTPEALAALQGRVFDPTMTRATHDAQQLAKGAQSTWLGKHWNAYVEKGGAQAALRDSMDLWAGQLHAAGRPDHEIQRGFFLSYGVDVLSAQALDAKDAAALKERIDRRVNSL